MKFKLRDYQINSIQLLRECIKKNSRNPVILCLPTGAGKTVTFASIVEATQKKMNRCSVVCHRNELIEQAENTLTNYGVNPLFVTYGMVQTFVRSPHKIPESELFIIDECHIGNFKRFVEIIKGTQPNAQIIGVTATPIGASKKKPLRDVFSDVVAPVQISELINQGFLSKPVYHVWKIDESKLVRDFKGEFTTESQSKVFHIDDLIEAVNRRVGKTIIFCSSIEQTVSIAETLTVKDVFFVHSKMNDKERKVIITQYKNTPNAIIVNCGILTAGFDDPTIETVIVYRATTSISLWLQMCGRGSRVIDGVKKTFYIFDLGNNRQRLLAWEVDRDWKALFDLQGRNIKDKQAPMKSCSSCEATIFASQMVCPYCSEKQPVKEKEDIRASKIEIINHYSDLPENLQKPYSLMSVKELIDRAQYGSPKTGRPFKNAWIIHQLKKRENGHLLLKKFAEIKGYKQGYIQRFLN